MKKTLVIFIVSVMILLVCAPFVSATTNAELPDKLMAIASKYGATDADKIKIERYLADYPVTDAQADQIMAKAYEAAAVMEKAGVTDIRKLSTAQKNQLKTIANEAASIVGVTLSFRNDGVDIYKNGKRIESVTLQSTTVLVPGTGSNLSSGTVATGSTSSATTSSGTKLVYTGSNSYKVLTVSGIMAVVALAAIVGKKKCLI